MLFCRFSLPLKCTLMATLAAKQQQQRPGETKSNKILNTVPIPIRVNILIENPVIFFVIFH